jgi:ammonium transporter, Amt family
MLLPSPERLNSGNNAWQLAAATFVGLRSIPGLTILYGGLVKKKWAINSAFMLMYAFCAVLSVWLLWSYNRGFGEQWFPFAAITVIILAGSVFGRMSFKAWVIFVPICFWRPR